MSYSDKLRDPRWQKKRLEILKRDEFTCQTCGSTEKELHVHHKSYLPKTSPWEYSNESLTTLCKDCHSHRTEMDRRLSCLLGEVHTTCVTELVFALEFYRDNDSETEQTLPPYGNLSLAVECCLLSLMATFHSYFEPRYLAFMLNTNRSRLEQMAREVSEASKEAECQIAS